MIEILERSHGNVIGMRASDEISEADIAEVAPKLDALIEQYGKINWLLVMETAKYGTLRAMYEDLMWAMRNLKHFDRMAIVGNKPWEELLIKADGLVFGEKYFDASKLDEAWDYVEGRSD